MNEHKHNFIAGILGVVLALALSASGTRAAEIYFGVDVPIDLFSTTFTTNLIVKTPDTGQDVH